MIYSSPIPALMYLYHCRRTSSEKSSKHRVDHLDVFPNYDTFSDVIIHLKNELSNCRFKLECGCDNSDDIDLKISELSKLLDLYSNMRDIFLSEDFKDE